MRDLDRRLAWLGERLSFSGRLSFEWSLRLAADEACERDRLICWIHHDGAKADAEIALCRQFLQFDCLSALPSADILSLGIGIGREWSIYLHFRRNGEEKYQAFSGTSQREYRFFYFPCTHDLEPPEAFVVPALRGAFMALAGEPQLQATSGFWLRQGAGGVDQVCLSYPHGPRLAELREPLAALSKADLYPYHEQHVRHVAFNQDASVTLYISGRTAAFPESFEQLKSLVHRGARLAHSTIAAVFQGLPSASPPPDLSLDDFYSPRDHAAWARLLGPNMFYHFGLFEEKDDPADTWSDQPFYRAVEDLCRHIDAGENVYDLGCGYGGVSRYLQNTWHCRCVAATISRVQYQHCARLGLRSRYTDMERSLPPGVFDTILLFESLEHVKNKYALLARLRRFTKKLVIRTSTQECPANNIVFGGSMNVVSSTTLTNILEECGYKIVHFENKRKQSMPTFKVWKDRLDAVPLVGDFHYDMWRKFVHRVLTHEREWAREHMLLDLVAV